MRIDPSRGAPALALLLVLGACGPGRPPSSSGDERPGLPPSRPLRAAPPAVDPSAADTAVVAMAAGSGGIDFYSARELAQAADALGRRSSTARTVGSRAGLRYVEARRSASGTPEVHDDWTDVTVVQTGRATLLTGGRVRGGATTAPGEHRGGTILGGISRAVAPGDFFVIPAGVPHQYLVARGDSVRYLTVKVRAAAP